MLKSAAFLACLLLAAVSPCAAKSAADWVADADDAEYEANTYYFAISGPNDAANSCSVARTKGGKQGTPSATAVPDGPITLPSGQGAKLVVCGVATDAEHYFTAPELFAASALRKFQSDFMEVKGDVGSACAAFDDSCCEMYIVPVTAGTYSVMDKSCDVSTITVSAATPPNTIEQATIDNVPSKQINGEDASSSSWSGWTTAVDIRVILLRSIRCEGYDSDDAPDENEGSQTINTEDTADPTESEGEMAESEGEDADGNPVGVSENEGESDVFAGAEIKNVFRYDSGHSGVSAAQVDSDGDTGEQEGLSEGENPAFEAVDPERNAIEMIVNRAYAIQFNLVETTGAHYLSSPDFFSTCILRKVEDEHIEAKFATYFTEAELRATPETLDETAPLTIYVVPTKVGEYAFYDKESDSISQGVFRVVADQASLTDPAEIDVVEVMTPDTCMHAGESEGEGEGEGGEGEGEGDAAGHKSRSLLVAAMGALALCLMAL